MANLKFNLCPRSRLSKIVSETFEHSMQNCKSGLFEGLYEF